MGDIPKLEKHFFRPYSVKREVTYGFTGNNKGCDLVLEDPGNCGCFQARKRWCKNSGWIGGVEPEAWESGPVILLKRTGSGMGRVGWEG